MGKYIGYGLRWYEDSISEGVLTPGISWVLSSVRGRIYILV